MGAYAEYLWIPEDGMVALPPKVVVRTRLIERLNEGLSACDKPEGMPKESRLDYGNDAPLVQ